MDKKNLVTTDREPVSRVVNTTVAGQQSASNKPPPIPVEDIAKMRIANILNAAPAPAPPIRAKNVVKMKIENLLAPAVDSRGYPPLVQLTPVRPFETSRLLSPLPEKVRVVKVSTTC
ncbi:hypothetical protein OCU04_003965 [Sclerotinia nivalis]|uniref:Uncharacterized protein n=1 Tax=Sclerotinia nivalis TaxID=352851 RepID=A0A9X0AT03_9HELO|nr:hypothetical protein OCU04_003965 [Sclerotinia nivalis]